MNKIVIVALASFVTGYAFAQAVGERALTECGRRNTLLTAQVDSYQRVSAAQTSVLREAAAHFKNCTCAAR